MDEDRVNEDQLKHLIEQGNKYVELKAAIEQLALDHPEIRHYLAAIIEQEGSADAINRLAPLAGRYTHFHYNSECFGGAFNTPGDAISAAIDSIEPESSIKNGRTIYSIGTLTHPIPWAYGDGDCAKELGADIIGLISEYCDGELGSDEPTLAFNEKDHLNVARLVLFYARQSSEVIDYGISHGLSFVDNPELSKADNIALNEAEYLARRNGWQWDGERVFKIINGERGADEENCVYASNWLEAVAADKN